MTDSIIVDIVIVAIILLSALIGAKCGFIALVGKPFKIITSIGFAYVFSVQLTNVFVESFIGEVVSALPQPAVHVISIIISFVLIYIVSRIALSLILSLLNAIFDKGIFGILNKMLGLLFSVALAILFLAVLISLFVWLGSLPQMSDVAWISEFEGGYIYNLFINYSPIDVILGFLPS